MLPQIRVIFFFFFKARTSSKKSFCIIMEGIISIELLKRVDTSLSNRSVLFCAYSLTIRCRIVSNYYFFPVWKYINITFVQLSCTKCNVTNNSNQHYSQLRSTNSNNEQCSKPSKLCMKTESSNIHRFQILFLARTLSPLNTNLLVCVFQSKG